MELSWSTFLLEIINFLVLVWILKRFLYQPVLDVIARRRAGIEKTLSDARVIQTDAEKQQQQYEGRLADWEQERQQARTALAQELDAERTRKMAELQTALAQEREKDHVAESRRLAEVTHTLEEQALMQGARFVTRLLEQASGPDTEARLVEMVIAGLAGLSRERIMALRNSYGKTPGAVLITSAFPLAGDQRRRLTQALAAIRDPNIPLQFEQNSELLAGIRISIGAWEVGANLRDELKGFMEFARNE